MYIYEILAIGICILLLMSLSVAFKLIADEAKDEALIRRSKRNVYRKKR